MGYGDMQQFQMEHDQQHQQALVDAGGQPYSSQGMAYQNWKAQNDPSYQGPNQNQGFQPEFLDPAQHQLDPRYINEMRDIAFGDPGTSPWLQYQMQQDQIRQQSDMDALQRQGMSGLATQQGQMAMRGGLTSGATERLGQQNLVGMLQGRSDLSRSAAAREAAYRQAAEERQRNVLMAMPQAEMGYSGYHADLDKYATDQQNQYQAAQDMAKAIRAQGRTGGGGHGAGAIQQFFDDTIGSFVG